MSFISRSAEMERSGRTHAASAALGYRTLPPDPRAEPARDKRVTHILLKSSRYVSSPLPSDIRLSNLSISLASTCNIPRRDPLFPPLHKKAFLGKLKYIYICKRKSHNYAKVIPAAVVRSRHPLEFWGANLGQASRLRTRCGVALAAAKDIYLLSQTQMLVAQLRHLNSFFRKGKTGESDFFPFLKNHYIYIYIYIHAHTGRSAN